MRSFTIKGDGSTEIEFSYTKDGYEVAVRNPKEELARVKLYADGRFVGLPTENSNGRRLSSPAKTGERIAPRPATPQPPLADGQYSVVLSGTAWTPIKNAMLQIPDLAAFSRKWSRGELITITGSKGTMRQVHEALESLPPRYRGKFIRAAVQRGLNATRPILGL
jgi:hypothetical protein